MNRLLTIAALLAAAVQLGLLKSTPAHAEEPMEISREASRPANTGPPDFFSGEVVIKPLFDPNNHRNTGGAAVTFSASARSAWHTHPAGQTLVVTAGDGLGTGVGRSEAADQPRRCDLDTAGRQALARRNARRGDDPHRHPGNGRRQGR